VIEIMIDEEREAELSTLVTDSLEAEEFLGDVEDAEQIVILWREWSDQSGFYAPSGLARPRSRGQGGRGRLALASARGRRALREVGARSAARTREGGVGPGRPVRGRS